MCAKVGVCVDEAVVVEGFMGWLVAFGVYVGCLGVCVACTGREIFVLFVGWFRTVSNVGSL